MTRTVRPDSRRGASGSAASSAGLFLPAVGSVGVNASIRSPGVRTAIVKGTFAVRHEMGEKSQ